MTRDGAGNRYDLATRAARAAGMSVEECLEELEKERGHLQELAAEDGDQA